MKLALAQSTKMEEGRKRKYSHKDSPACSCGGPKGDENSYSLDNCENCSTKQTKQSDADESFNHPRPSTSQFTGKMKSPTTTPVPVFNKNLLAPGFKSGPFHVQLPWSPPGQIIEVVEDAPRVLQEHQQANAEPDILNLDTYNYQQYLRTPPSIKNQRVLFRGTSSVSQYRGYDRFDRVSDEIILRIFHMLPRHLMCTCALVCRRWARIVCDMSLWRRMDLGGRLVKRGVLKILLERGVEVLRLNRSEIKGDFQCTVQGVPDPRRSPLSEDRLYRLQYLDMSMANVETSLVESMVKFCPNLKKISLENIPVTEQLLINLSLNSPYLDTLNLCMSAGVTGIGLCSIFENCTSLAELNIAWTNLNAQDIQLVTRSLPSQILALNLSGCRERLSDTAVAALCKRSTQLVDLDISDATHITNDSLDTIIMYLQQLKMVSISRCYKISPGHIANLRDMPELERINIFGIMRDVTLEMMEQHLSTFKVNRYPFSAIGRPTVNNNRYVKIWNHVPRV